MNAIHKIYHTYDIELRLLPRLQQAFEKYDVPAEFHDAIIAESSKNFEVYSDDSIVPTKGHGSVDGFIKAFLDANMTDEIKVRLEKAKVLARLVEYATVGDMKRYRACRAEYSAL